jgi:triacylglycerol lipase
MLAKLGMASHVAAVATVSTPHRGSPYADWCAQHVGTKLRGFEVVRRLGLDVRGIRDLTTESCARFIEEIRDVPGVRYFSISTGRRWREIPAFGLPSWYVIHRVEGLNDGLVSVQSAKWAKHLASWNLDHWHAVNQRYGLVAIKEGDISSKYLDLIRKIDGEIDGEIAAN